MKFTCETCNRSFSNSPNLKQHIKTLHEVEVSLDKRKATMKIYFGYFFFSGNTSARLVKSRSRQKIVWLVMRKKFTWYEHIQHWWTFYLIINFFNLTRSTRVRLACSIVIIVRRSTNDPGTKCVTAKWSMRIPMQVQRQHYHRLVHLKLMNRQHQKWTEIAILLINYNKSLKCLRKRHRMTTQCDIVKINSKMQTTS